MTDFGENQVGHPGDLDGMAPPASSLTAPNPECGPIAG